MLDVLSTDYVRLARIKGVPERLVIWKHALRNVLIPVITFVTYLFVNMLMGSVVGVVRSKYAVFCIHICWIRNWFLILITSLILSTNS